MCGVLRYAVALALFLSIPLLAKAECRDSVLCVVPEDVLALDIEVVSKSKKWELIWNYVSDSEYRSARVKRLSAMNDDDIYKNVSSVELCVTSGGHAKVIASDKVSHQSDRCGLRIELDDGAVRMRGGDGQRIFSSTPQAAVDFLGNSPILVRTTEPEKLQVIRTLVKPMAPSPRSSFPTVDSLYSYLASSTDSIEAVWEYMDREVNTDKATLGGLYRIATVRAGDGYDIIYLGGSDHYKSRWKPLHLRGHMVATQFVNNFDLYWPEASRTLTFKTDTYASYDAHLSLLTLHFPIYESSVRFRKCYL